ERVEVAVRQEGAAGTVVRVRSVPVPRTGTGEGVGARAGAAVVERGGAGARPGVRGGVAGGPPGAGHRVAAARGPRTAGVVTEAVAVAVETVGGVTVETVVPVAVDGLGARSGGPLAAEVVAAPGELVQGPAGGVGHRSALLRLAPVQQRRHPGAACRRGPVFAVVGGTVASAVVPGGAHQLVEQRAGVDHRLAQLLGAGAAVVRAVRAGLRHPVHAPVALDVVGVVHG